MPSIISSTKLRNEYNEVSQTCHEQMAPIFVTRNGDGDLAVMSIEAYEALARRSSMHSRKLLATCLHSPKADRS